MITLHEHPENVFLCHLKSGKKKSNVYWHPRKNKEMRMAVDDLQSFNTEKIRDKFRVSQKQMTEIIDNLKTESTPEGALQSKFFKIKKYIEESLYSSMDLHGGDQELEVNYPDGNDTWAELEVCMGGSGCGKTSHLKNKIKRNLDGPKKNRRKFLWISNEFLIDKTLNDLKKPKYSENFRGIDISDDTYDNSQYDTTDDFYKTEVSNEIDCLCRGSCVIIDDGLDSPIRSQLLFKINKMLRTCRHRGIGLAYVLHRIRSGTWSQQASSSCKYYSVFPKSGKGKIAEFLKDQGLTAKEARDTVNDYGECDARCMMVRLHSPQAFINKKLLRLF